MIRAFTYHTVGGPPALVVRAVEPSEPREERQVEMLAQSDAMATIAVRDLRAAREFYEGLLGLEWNRADGSGVATCRSGDSTIVVYESRFAGTNRATTVTWDVGEEIDELVQTLRGAGVVFEHYDLPGLRREGDIHVAGDFKAAWFEDPDGNILHMNNGGP